MTDIAPTLRFLGTHKDLRSQIGTAFGPSSGFVVTQERIQLFADATGDHQWIHVDHERAAASPFGTTVAHGYLTLALIPQILAEVVTVSDSAMGINYGLNNVRFPGPVPCGAIVTALVTVAETQDVQAGTLATFDITLRVDGIERPVCVAQTLVLYAA